MQDKVTYTPKAVLIFYIIYEINLWPYDVCKDFTLGNSSFGSVNITKTLILISIFIVDM